MKRVVVSFVGVLFFALPSWSSECDVDLREDYNVCAEVTWVEGPHLNTSTRNRLESIVSFAFWTLDEQGAQVYVAPPEDLMILPWMDMHGHSHGTYYVESRVEDTLVLSEMIFSEMGGFPWLILFVSKEDPFLPNGNPKPIASFEVRTQNHGDLDGHNHGDPSGHDGHGHHH